MNEYPMVAQDGSASGTITLKSFLAGYVTKSEGASSSSVGSVDAGSVGSVSADAVLIHNVVRWQRAARRQGTHSTLTKGEMRGGNKKPWKQKGTGRARAGSNTSPLWVGGGITFGPKPRNYEYRLSKRAKRQGLIAALGTRLQEERVSIVESIDVPSGKTKEALQFLSKISGLTATEKKGLSLLVVVDGNKQNLQQEKFWKAIRNLPGLICVPAAGVNVYDILRTKSMLITKAAFEQVQSRLEKE